MRYKYHTVDVFTETRFGGNPLAVLPQASGLSDTHMQSIAREFNYSETTFVLPPEHAMNDAKVRIFTPDREIPFAGHPNLGTAHVLSTIAYASEQGGGERILRFEELGGVVPVLVRPERGLPSYYELTAPQTLELGTELSSGSDIENLARVISLDPQDIMTGTHYPRRASVGLPFLCIEVKNRDALGRSQIRTDYWARVAQRTACDAIHLYTRDTGTDACDLRCRMYAPTYGVREDPATGSANCALAALLTLLADDTDKTFSYRITQGVEMGRASKLLAVVEKREGVVVEVRIGGACVSVADGSIEVV